MIVVTGNCRTGTSLVMQTLRLLGVPVLGEAFPRHCEGAQFNWKGYWELPLEQTVRGLKNTVPSRSAVKLIGRMLARTPMCSDDKVIVCVRGMTDTIRSTMEVDDYSWLEASLVYQANYAAILPRLARVRHMFVVYEKAMLRPEQYVRDIASFVGVARNDAAVQNIEREKVWQ